MAPQNQEQKFFEVIKPHSTYEFIGNQKYWIGLSIVLVLLTVVMLPLNAYLFKSRGHMLNWGVDFRGGTELMIEFGKPIDARRALDARFGAGTVAAIPQVESVGAKAGKQLQYDGVRSLLYAILLIMVYIAFRFDFRYGPGTVVALLHDAVICVGAFAVTY